MINSLLKKVELVWVKRSSKSLIKYYRKKGINIGDGCVFRSPSTAQLDIMRPSLITIGNNVDMNKNFTIMSHDFSHRVFVPLYGEFLSSSGAVSIGNNIYFGINVTVLKGVFIGDNCIIAAGSVVTKSIPSNSVAAGVPCKVICTIEEYYERRKNQWIEEAIDYAKTIINREKRRPTIDDFRSEFGLYIDSHNIKDYDVDPIKYRLKEKFEYWLVNHQARFNGFDDFIKNIENE